MHRPSCHPHVYAALLGRTRAVGPCVSRSHARLHPGVGSWTVTESSFPHLWIQTKPLINGSNLYRIVEESLPRTPKTFPPYIRTLLVPLLVIHRSATPSSSPCHRPVVAPPAMPRWPLRYLPRSLLPQCQSDRPSPSPTVRVKPNRVHVVFLRDFYPL
jgi:hypothetical protein